MTAEELVGRFYEAFDDNKIDEAVAAFAEDLEIVDPGMGTVHGRGRFREDLETFKRAMPDAHVVVEHRSEAAGTVVVAGPVRRDLHGTAGDR